MIAAVRKELLLQWRTRAQFMSVFIFGATALLLFSFGVGFTTYLHRIVRPKELTPWGTPKQAARMIKCVCDECGWTFRAARSWIEKGLPSCSCGDGVFIVQE